MRKIFDDAIYGLATGIGLFHLIFGNHVLWAALVIVAIVRYKVPG